MLFRSRQFQELRIELARIAGAVDVMKDHENRLRRIERYMYAIPASVAGSAAAIVIAWISHTH